MIKLFLLGLALGAFAWTITWSFDLYAVAQPPWWIAYPACAVIGPCVWLAWDELRRLR